MPGLSDLGIGATNSKKSLAEMMQMAFQAMQPPPAAVTPTPPTPDSAAPEISAAQEAERKVKGRAANMLFSGGSGSGSTYRPGMGNSSSGGVSISRRTLLGA